MKLGSTLQSAAAPTDKHTSSLNVLDSIGQWRSLFERSALGVAMIDSRFHFLIANPAFLTMFGYSSEELQQLSFLDICIDEAGDECRIPLRELREGVRLQYEIEAQHRRKDGTSLPVNTFFSAVSERGSNQRAFLTVTVDISARRVAEDALRVAQSELEQPCPARGLAGPGGTVTCQRCRRSGPASKCDWLGKKRRTFGRGKPSGRTGSRSARHTRAQSRRSDCRSAWSRRRFLLAACQPE